MGHTDPKRRVVIGGPVALRDFDGGEVPIEEWTRTDLIERTGLELDASVGVEGGADPE